MLKTINTYTSWMQGDNSMGTLRKNKNRSPVPFISDFMQKRRHLLDDCKQGFISKEELGLELKKLSEAKNG